MSMPSPAHLHQDRPRRRPVSTHAMVASAVALLSLSACGGNQSMFNPAGPAARSIATLGWTMLGITSVVYALVIAVLVWALLRRRSARDNDPATTRALTASVERPH